MRGNDVTKNPPSYTFSNKRSNYFFKGTKKYTSVLGTQNIKCQKKYNSTASMKCTFYEEHTFIVNHKSITVLLYQDFYFKIC